MWSQTFINFQPCLNTSCQVSEGNGVQEKPSSGFYTAHAFTCTKILTSSFHSQSCEENGLDFSQHSDCAHKHRVNCFIHTAEGKSLASSSVTLAQRENCGEKWKAWEMGDRTGNRKKGRKIKCKTKRTVAKYLHKKFTSFVKADLGCCIELYNGIGKSVRLQRNQNYYHHIYIMILWAHLWGGHISVNQVSCKINQSAVGLWLGLWM